MSLEKKDAARATVLRALYDLGDGNAGRFVYYERLAELTGLQRSDVVSAAEYLMGQGLADATFSDKLVALSHDGVVAWEDVLRELPRASANSVNRRPSVRTVREESVSVPSIFLSHNTKDKFFVRELANRLNERGVRVWVDEAEIRVGDSLTDKVGTAIKANDYVGVVLSKNSIGSEWVKRELQVALQREFAEKRVVVLPILIERVELPPFLADKLYADFTDTDSFGNAFAKLLEALGVAHEPVARMPDPVAHPQSVRIDLAPVAQPSRAFEDISIEDLQVEKSHKPDPTRALYNMYLRLSAVPPPDWVSIFDAERRFPRHSMWRRAWIENGSIVVYCVPDELERYHLSDLQLDVANANSKYRDYLGERERREQEDLKNAHQSGEDLKALRKRLVF